MHVVVDVVCTLPVSWYDITGLFCAFCCYIRPRVFLEAVRIPLAPEVDHIIHTIIMVEVPGIIRYSVHLHVSYGKENARSVVCAAIRRPLDV